MTSQSQLHSLLQPVGGLFSRSIGGYPEIDEPQLASLAVDLGNVGAVWPEAERRGISTLRLRAGGSGLTMEDALLPALAEGLERYSAGVFRDEELIVASAEELGESGVDLTSLPKCSDRELENPRCPLVLPNTTEAIRWVKALSLLDGREVFVPAVMAYLYLGALLPGERFWLQTSTGCAAHRSYKDAIEAAICEIIERDAVSVIWLQQVSVPKLRIDAVDKHLQQCWESCNCAAGDLRFHFFDATTDLGVPTIYGVQEAPYNEAVSTLVACSSSPSPIHALCKVMRDMRSLRPLLSKLKNPPRHWDDFSDTMHGASFMALPEQRSQFNFLLDTNGESSLSSLETINEANAFDIILQRLKHRSLDTFVVDLTTDEAYRVGMRVVRVIIPGLQPLSFRHRARFLGHPRLYDLPARMGFPVRCENDINPYPQPFA